MLEELEGQLDLNRLHFLGRIPHPQLIGILQASWVQTSWLELCAVERRVRASASAR